MWGYNHLLHDYLTLAIYYGGPWDRHTFVVSSDTSRITNWLQTGSPYEPRDIAFEYIDTGYHTVDGRRIFVLRELLKQQRAR